jgi:hypothetical protein
MTFSTLAKKSASLATFRLERMANMPASVQTERSSAPVALGQRRAMRSKRMLRSTDMLTRERARVSNRSRWRWRRKGRRSTREGETAGEERRREEGKRRRGTHLRAWIRRMWARPSASGRENSMRRSIRPGRRRAGSRVSGLVRDTTGQQRYSEEGMKQRLTCW